MNRKFRFGSQPKSLSLPGPIKGDVVVKCLSGWTAFRRRMNVTLPTTAYLGLNRRGSTSLLPQRKSKSLRMSSKNIPTAPTPLYTKLFPNLRTESGSGDRGVLSEYGQAGDQSSCCKRGGLTGRSCRILYAADETQPRRMLVNEATARSGVHHCLL